MSKVSLLILLVLVIFIDGVLPHELAPKRKKAEERSRQKPGVLVVEHAPKYANNQRFETVPTTTTSTVTTNTTLAPTVSAASVATTLLNLTSAMLGAVVNNYDARVNNFIMEYTKATLNEDAILRINALLVKYGYPVDEHQVQTEDGYVLKVFRIPGNGSAVFLMHGLLGSADDFVVAGPDNGLAYLLADAGYDVWMGNARGNKHSRKNLHHTPDSQEFWDFSWHEIGVYDLPAMIDYTLNVTKQSSLQYVGHSQGTTSFFVMASERPEYNEKVSLMIAMSPVAYMGNVKSPMVRLLAPGTQVLHKLSERAGINEFLPDNNLMRSLKLLVCGTGPLAEIMCENTMFLLTGYDLNQLNVSNLPVILGHMPSGASVKQFTHYGQGVSSKEFRKFDYGSSEENVEHYGVKIPPKYALENILTPVCLFYSQSDWLAHPKDVDKLYKRLNNVVDYYRITLKLFNHLDFLFAKDVKKYVYDRVLMALSSNVPMT